MTLDLLLLGFDTKYSKYLPTTANKSACDRLKNALKTLKNHSTEYGNSTETCHTAMKCGMVLIIKHI